MVILTEQDPYQINSDSDNDYEDELEDYEEAEEEFEAGQKLIGDYDSDEEEYLAEESIFERLAALIDIVPPTTRARISNVVDSTISVGFGIGSLVGNGLWVVVTGALLVVLPISMELEKEAMLIQQEFDVSPGQV
jgi:hypothetical protein